MALSGSSHLGEEKSDVTSGAVSCTFTAFTPQNDSVLAVWVFYVGDATPGTTGTLTGGSLSWTRQVISTTGSGGGYFWNLEGWYAKVVGAGPSTTLNYANASISATDVRVQVSARSWTGYDTTTPIGGSASWDSGSSGTGSGSLDNAPATNDAVFAARIWVPNGGTNTTATAAAGSTEIHEVSGSAGYGNLETQQRLSDTSKTVVWTEINDAALTAWANQERAGAMVIREVNSPALQFGIYVTPLFIFQ